MTRLVHHTGPRSADIALCGTRDGFCSGIRRDITCPKCIARLNSAAPGQRP